MAVSPIVSLIFLCILHTIHVANADKLVYVYTNQYNLIWNDRESGAKADVSIWKPVTFQIGFYPVGDTAVDNHSPPPNAAVLVKDVGNGLVKPPQSFRQIWNDAGSGAAKDVAIYQMVPPSGYICLGNVAVASHNQMPDANAYRCVYSDLVIVGFAFLIWDDRGSGANADVSLWRPELNPTKPLGLITASFIAVNNYNRPPETPYVLNFDKITLPSTASSPDAALVVYLTNEVVDVWDDRGSGANRDVSFWRADHCCTLGFIAVDNYHKPIAVFAKEIKPMTLAKPYSFSLIWSDRGSGAKRDGAIWRPQCPPNYVALGYAATSNYSPPSVEDFRCVKVDYVTPGQWSFVWDDRGSGANDDVSIWRADALNAQGQGINAMAGVKKHGPMDIPPSVLKSQYVIVHNSKPTKRVVLYDIKYNFNDKQILRTEPLELSGKTKVQNCAAPSGSPSVYTERQLTFTVESESSWSFQCSVEIGVTVELSAGIPGIADMSVSSSITTTFTVGTAGRRTESRTDQITAKVEARPKYSIDYFIIGKRYTANIPWEGKMKTFFEDGTTNVENVKGVYVGVQVAEITVSADAPILCG